MENTGKTVLRVGLSLVFFWFALNQLMNPDYWTGFIPTFITGFGLSAHTFVILNGTVELALAALLILGLYTRLVSLLLSLHLFGIALSIGIDPIGVRDFGLACAALSIFFMGPDKFTLDNKIASKSKEESDQK